MRANGVGGPASGTHFNTKANDLSDAMSGLGSDGSSKSSVTPRRMTKHAFNNNDDESGGAGSSSRGNRSMRSQKGGQFSQAIRQHTQMSEALSSSSRGGVEDRDRDRKGSKHHARKSSRHDQLRELVGEIVSNMGYDGIPIVRIKGNKYLIGTEV